MSTRSRVRISRTPETVIHPDFAHRTISTRIQDAGMLVVCAVALGLWVYVAYQFIRWSGL